MSDSSDDCNTTSTPTPTQKNGWKSLNPMNNKRGMAGGVCINDNQFLVIGGSEDFDDDSSQLSSCEYYDANRKTWNRLPINIPTACSGFGVVSFDNEVFVMGGMNDPESFRSNVISIEFSGALTPRTWKILPPMKQARSLFACVLHSKYIYVIGGLDASKGALDTAERYNIETKTWTILPNMPGARLGCAAGIVGNNIYVVGGEDSNDEELASTVVFNTFKQKWESTPVPDMKKKRGMLSVVAVDQYVIAIGGGDEDGNLLSTIEVLDTQRNTWDYAPMPMQYGNCYQVAGVFKETNEIIVAGGANEEAANVTNLADCIRFEDGLLPPGFRNKERGQKVIGDTDQGKDQLGVGTIAEALGETLVFKDLEPPFVLGIFGKWGRGKSYFFNLMLERIIGIQKKPVDNLVRDTFAGHIYIVKFDAWTFSKGNIWSSLIYQILKALNEQLQFEEGMGDKILQAGGVSTIEVFRDLSSGKLEYLEKYPKSVSETYLGVKKNGDRASERLLKAINPSYKQDQEDLERIENEMQKIQKKRIQKQVTTALEDIDKIVVKKAQEDALKNVVKEKKNPGDVDDQSIDDLIKHIENIGDYENLIEEINSIKWWNYRLLCSNIPPFALICSSFFLILSLVLFQLFNDYTITTLTGLISAVFPIVASFSSAVKQMDPIVTELRNQAATDQDLEVGSFNDEYTGKLKDQEQKKRQIENRSLALRGCSLRETITNKLFSTKCEGDLGIVYKVQEDIQRLSDGMLNKRRTDNVFPRGDPRIVLFVDNLDRCEQRVVVEVVGALQLLLKTNLFVAVVAIDPRYATLSLEKHYKGVLNPQTPLSGIDYLEKIIQIPFCLPGAGQDYVGTFVKSQIDIEEPQDTSECNQSVVNNRGQGKISVSTSSDTSGFQNAVDTRVPDESKPEDQALPRHKVLFSKEDGNMMTQLFKLFEVGPRRMTRMINIFKLLLVIWRRDNKFEADHNLKRATLFLMLLSSEESTREVTHTVFELMELGMVKYHHVMQDDEFELQNENNLGNLFKTELQKWDTSFVLSSRNEANTQGTLMAYVEEYLTEYRWTSSEEWNAISSKFLFSRCFSFFHLASEENKNKQQPLNYDQRRRMHHGEVGTRRNHSVFSPRIDNRGRSIITPTTDDGGTGQESLNLGQGRKLNDREDGIRYNHSELNSGRGLDNNYLGRGRGRGKGGRRQPDLCHNPYNQDFAVDETKRWD